METFGWKLCFLITLFIGACNSQDIASFDMVLGDTTCMEPNIVHELDTIFFFTTLYFNYSLNINNWFYFAVYAIDKAKRQPRRLVGDVPLFKCSNDISIAHEVVKDPKKSGCFITPDRIFLAVVVLAKTSLSQMDFYGQWHSIETGYLKTNKTIAGPLIITRELEILGINTFLIPMLPDIAQLNVDKTRPLKIEYCVTNLKNHTLTLRVGNKTLTTHTECLESDADTIGVDDMEVGYQEHEGFCKSAQKRLFLLHHSGERDIHPVPKKTEAPPTEEPKPEDEAVESV